MARNVRRIIPAAVLLSLILVFISAGQQVHAANSVGTLSSGGHTVSYDDFDDLVDDLEDDYENSSVTIEMTTSWNAETDSDYDERLIIPSNCKATLNMNGNVFSRGNTKDNDWCLNGELITVNSGATLTINGGDTSVRHDHWVYSSTNRDSKADAVKTFYGGLLTGGASTNGSGGIHVKSDCTVTLNNVTIAGCRAEAPWFDTAGTNSAYGGGIWLTGGNSNLRMNNSTITGCFAYYDGGGVFQSNHNYVNIELSNSHIDQNYAADEGGGLDVDGEYVHISGTKGSTISGNQSATAGGGIYIWNDDTSMSGVTLSGNLSKNGGAIYTKEETISLSALTVKNNTATERGGGIYVNNDGNTISSCEITGNRAYLSGGGVYVNDDVDESFSVTGKTIIKDNTADTFNDSRNNNLYISDNDPDDSKVAFNLTKGSDVHLGYYNTEDRDAIMVNRDGSAYKDINCIQFLTADNPGYHFTYNSRPNYRKIFYVKDGKDNVEEYGEQAQKPNDPTDVSAEKADGASGKTAEDHSTSAGVIGRVDAGGEVNNTSGEYDLIRGFYTHEKTDSDTEDTDASFYYSDAFFDAEVDPKIYNEHLATASWILAFSGTYLRKFDDEDANGNIYYNKHAGARQFFADIGCPDQNIYVNKSMASKPGTDSIGVTIGSKELAKTGGEKTGKILIPVAVRGGGYEAEWASNVTLGKAADVAGKEAKGFAEAANEVTKEIDKYIKNYELEDKIAEGNVVFWVSGFSRAGATANLTAKRLVEKYACEKEGKMNKVFAYPCEAPKGGADAAQQETDDKYFCIHNMINAVDIVPLVATTQMGAKRYGVDHYIPGSDKYTFYTDITEDTDRYDGGTYFKDKRTNQEYVTLTEGYKILKTVTSSSQGGTGGPTTVTTYRDNEIRLQSNFKDGDEAGSVEANEYYRETMMPHLRAIDSGMTYDNYFHPMTMSFIPPKMKEYGYYKNNHIEYFVLDFVRLLQEGNGTDDWSKAVTSRDYWATTLQPVMRDTMSLVFSMSGDNKEGFVGRAGSIMDKINYVGGEVSMWELYRNVVGEWNELSQEDKDKYTTFLLKKLKETGAFDFLSESDRAKLERNWPTLADFIFHITDCDYNYKPVEQADGSLTSRWGKGSSGEKDTIMTLVPTFATFSSFVLQNHYPEINIAWTRSYDSYYEDEKTEYEIKTDNYSVSKPSLTLKSADGKKTTLAEGEEANEVNGDQEIILEVEDIAGEAIYYDVLKYNGADKYVAVTENQLYRKGDTLEANDNQNVTKYKVKTYAMSYSVRSDVAEYDIEVRNDRHKVTVTTEKTDGTGAEINEQWYKEGDDVRITAVSPSTKYFTNWTAKLLDQNQNESDITVDLLGSSVSSATAAFKMPEVGDDYPEGYVISLAASYGDRIKKITGALDVPVPGQKLDTKAELTFDNGASSVTRPVTWTYTYEDEEEQTKTVSADKGYDDTTYLAEINIPQDQASGLMFRETAALEWSSEAGFTLKSIRRNDNDGSVIIILEYKTDKVEGETHKRPDVYIPLKINEKDLNLNTNTGTVESSVLQNQDVTLTAPEVEDERFIGWDLKTKEHEDNYGQITLKDGSDLSNKTITITTAENITVNELVIEAQYVPLVNKIEVTVDEPAGGKALAKSAGMKVKITNEYEISPDNISIEWFPAPSGEDKKAEYMTAYTAVVSVERDDQGRINVKKEGSSEYEAVTMAFFYSDALTVTVNGNSAVCDTGSNSVIYTFAATKYTLDSVIDPDDITDVEHRAGMEDIRNLLPATAKVTTKNGISLDAKVTWEDPVAAATDDPREETVWTAQGKVTLPATVNAPEDADLTVTVRVIVNEANHISAPSATLSSGEYLYDQSTALETAAGEGYTTYYTTDGSDPTTSGTRNTYTEGEEIALLRSDATAQGDGAVKRITLKAYTVKNDGSEWDSSVATYVYDFTNNVTVPVGKTLTYSGHSQIGVESGGFYTLTVEEESGAEIDGSGNAVAAELGKYTVTAKIQDGFRWKIKKDDSSEDEYEYTTEDQTIEFEITNAIPIPEGNDVTYNGEAQVGLDKNGLYTLTAEDGSGVTIDENGNATAVEKGKYTVTAKIRDGYYWKIKKENGEYDTTTEDQTVEFEIKGASIRLAEIGPVEDRTYTGYEITPEVRVTFRGREMVEGEDYTLEFDKNTDAGQASIIVKGTGNFDDPAGSILEGTFNILKASVVITADDNSKVQGHADPKLTWKASGIENQAVMDQIPVIIVRKLGEKTGTYPIMVSVDPDYALDNFDIEFVPGTFTIIADRTKQKGKDGTWFGKGAALEAAEAALARMTTDKDPKGTKFAPLKVKSTKQTRKSIKLTWKKASGAKKYIIYANRCGKGKKLKKLVTLGSARRAYNVKKAAGKLLRKGTYYKFMIIAVNKNNNVVTSSKIEHVATAGNKKRANYRKVIVKAKITKTGKKLKKYRATNAIRLKKGRKTLLRTVLKKAKKTVVRRHIGPRYESSNKNIAKVTAKGRVTAVKKGTCRIYVFAQNGIVKAVKVTVR